MSNIPQYNIPTKTLESSQQVNILKLKINTFRYIKTYYSGASVLKLRKHCIIYSTTKIFIQVSLKFFKQRS